MKNDKGVIRSWAFYDWANSAFALVITVAVFPSYFTNVSPEEIQIGNFTFTNSSIYSYSISIAYLLIAFSSPLFSGIADHAGRRMSFLKFFTLLGGLSCMLLYLFSSGENWWYGLLLFMIGVIAFSGGLVFYNSYLPLIASKDQQDRVSAKGFAYGYVGSVLLLIANLAMIQYPDFFGFSDAGHASRMSFAMVGVWWIGFGWFSFRRLPKDLKTPIRWQTIYLGYREIIEVSKRAFQHPYLLRFLISFFFYSAGVQTVLFLASTFARKELAFGEAELILVVLLLQIIAIFGAYLFAWVSRIKGNQWSLAIMILIWIAICGFGYVLTAKFHFYILSSFVGLVMGGIQSQSRSTYSKLLKKREKNVSSFFSFYDLVEKVAIVMGTFTFAALDQWTGNMRTSLLALSVFFAIGLVILLTIKIRPASKAPQSY